MRLGRHGLHLDLLVDKSERTTLFDLGRPRRDLQALLGVRLDVVTSNALHRRIRKRLLDEAKPV